MLQHYKFESLSCFRKLICLLFLFSNMIASDAERIKSVQQELVKEPGQKMGEENTMQICFDENESPEGYTAPAVHVSKEGYLSYTDEIKLRRIRQQQK